MNRQSSQALRLSQLSDQLRPDRPLGAVTRPVGGWLRAVRQALGLTFQTVAGRMKLSLQAVAQLEKREATGAISLRQLESVAAAMGCRVVYTLVPIEGTLAELADADLKRAARSVEHTMALEGQGIKSPPTQA